RRRDRFEGRGRDRLESQRLHGLRERTRSRVRCRGEDRRLFNRGRTNMEEGRRSGILPPHKSRSAEKHDRNCEETRGVYQMISLRKLIRAKLARALRHGQAE